MVEQRPFKPLVGGSSPPRPTIKLLQLGSLGASGFVLPGLRVSCSPD